MNNGTIYTNPIVQWGAGMIMALAIVGTMVLFGYQTLVGKPYDPWEYTFLVTGLTLAANVLGYHQGSTAAQGQTQSTATAIKEVAASTTNGGDTPHG